MSSKANSSMFMSEHESEMGFPGGATGKEPTCQCRRLSDGSSVPGLGRSPERGHGNALQYSCLESPMARGDQQATVYSPWGCTELDMTEVTWS